MLSSFLSGAIAVGLSIVVMLLGWVLSKRAISDREKNSPFECGFDPIKSARLPFSLRFFLLAIIFLIFDVEIVLLFPVLVSMFGSFSLKILIGCSIFLVILIVGLFHEWNEGSLDWAQ
uniref:NADH-ubiquinone oxidoreductase chain 3 n=2 Tax=Potamopyrgus TaxID=145636 RepID=D3JAT1_POTAT|nr:NADH dehydrogenase subunit 3 [Potamopyrgus estuarinus]YP_010644161.1 NADH dehydrogenase subunit 3 [Potamopyrgus antipodarum]WMX20492.1 NADH dehydrogenase subunit 3 [Potamopyrgus kaitunuparaoa]ADB93379.1 NADH dehydrogenase subunit 3 [Potamopyrgus estuarinus]ADB93392.1 NADH dehydrogenase subunit 3 [Potamopyrgus antipodarum]ADB93470.1 NADH dehydrogenase subunit 3 [Potamopyrgus antipodarum]AVY52128.1 NADH dehydrogenase subunit 3 [Potamopyrgus antipodarum]